MKGSTAPAVVDDGGPFPAVRLNEIEKDLRHVHAPALSLPPQRWQSSAARVKAHFTRGRLRSFFDYRIFSALGLLSSGVAAIVR
jgi:hypothetical protein